jgi:hypothetical protein
MRKSKTPLLDLYYEMMKTGRLTNDPIYGSENGGLCEVLMDIPEDLTGPDYKNFDHMTLRDQFEHLFKPFTGGYFENRVSNVCDAVYWGSGDTQARKGEFTEFRQTLWLLFCAVKGEL